MPPPTPPVGPFPAPRLRRLALRPAHRAGRSGTRESPSGPGNPGGGPGGPGGERCDLCSQPLPSEHRHLLDIRADAVSCACRACALLFDRREAGGAHYRLLPLRRVRLTGEVLDDALWAGLGVPVGLAFFTRAGESGEVRAGYPSPMGLLRATVDPHHWHEVESGLAACAPDSAAPADDVEALLVDRTEGVREHWIVPLDDCYRLTAVVRAHWRGLNGGPEVWRHIGDFFRSLPAGRAAGPSPPPHPTASRSATRKEAS
ncbi:DUF5947 family protein [Streptomyces carminius]|uniref:DUF5947 family protein n=1 Tax=Streptomyces carminius TaxID=2665496 RepID=UPI0011B727DC|nr:DUF5947 family protein [Streptomyces carminius]